MREDDPRDMRDFQGTCNHILGMINQGIGRCGDCGKPFLYIWATGIDHFPLECDFCGAQAVILVPDDEELTPDDLATIDNHITEIEAKRQPKPRRRRKASSD